MSIDLPGDRMSTIRRAAALVALILLLAGCTVHVETGTGEAGTGIADPGAPGNGILGSTPSTVPNVPSAIVVAPPNGQPGDFTTAQLQDALLREADLAPGWTTGTSTINSSGPPKTGCPALDSINYWPATKVIIGFFAGDGNTQLAEVLSSMPVDSAKELIRTARTVHDQCLTITVADNAGNPHVQDVTEPTFPKFGDETYTMRMGSADTFYSTTVMIRKGGTVLVAGSLNRTAESPLLEAFARQALARADSKLK